MIIKKYKEIFISVIIILIIVCGYAIKYTFFDKNYANIENKEASEEKIIDNNMSVDEEIKLSMQKGERFIKYRWN